MSGGRQIELFVGSCVMVVCVFVSVPVGAMVGPQRVLQIFGPGDSHGRKPQQG